MITWTKLTIVKVSCLFQSGLLPNKKKPEYSDIRIEAGTAVHNVLSGRVAPTDRSSGYVKITVKDEELFIRLDELESALKVAKTGLPFEECVK